MLTVREEIRERAKMGGQGDPARLTGLQKKTTAGWTFATERKKK